MSDLKWRATNVAENGNSSDDNYDNDNNLYNDDDANGDNLYNHDNADICRCSTGQRTWQLFSTLQRPELEIRETRWAVWLFVALVTSLTCVLLFLSIIISIIIINNHNNNNNNNNSNIINNNKKGDVSCSDLSVHHGLFHLEPVDLSSCNNSAEAYCQLSHGQYVLS